MSQHVPKWSSELVEKWVEAGIKTLGLVTPWKIRQVKRVGFSRELRRNTRYRKKRPICPPTECGKAVCAAAHKSR